MHRRTFLQVGTSALGGLFFLFALPVSTDTKQSKAAAFQPNIWVSIEPDDTITVMISRIEMGQGLRTAFAMALAEELEADWSKVRVQVAPFDAKYGNQWSFASASTIMNYPIQREAGATARMMLIQSAAQRWNVPESECYAEKSKVIHRPSSRSLRYGELVADAAKLSPPQKPVLKNVKDFKIIGKPTPLVHTPDVVAGKPIYGLDFKVPGMLYASVERCSEFRGKIGNYRKERVMQLPGVKAVVEIPTLEGFYFVNTGIAVVADNYWAATQARNKLNAEWEAGPHQNENTESYQQQMRDLAQKPGLQVHHNQGDALQVLKTKSGNSIRASYETPFLAHAALEPLNCVVHVDGNRCTFWGGTQDIGGVAGAISEALKIPKENVTVNLSMVGGSFGRRIFQDFAIEAALISQAVKAPVKLIWSREDEMQHDFYRPMSCHQLEATLDAKGNPAAWLHRIVSTPVSANANASPTQLDVYEAEVGGASNLPYYIPNRRCEYQPFECGVPRGYWRGVALSHTNFATESFIDELADQSKRDPLYYRLSLMEGHALLPHPEGRDIYFYPYEMPRLTNVLKLATTQFGWTNKRKAGRGKGIACCAFHNAYVALAAEISVKSTAIKVHRITAAVDSGLIINPKAAEAQVQGAILQGLSVALHGKITIQNGSVHQTNFHDFPWLRMSEVPTIDVHFVNNNQPPTSIGEIALPPVAPAIVNALFNATGKRLRSLPFQLA